MRQSNLREVSRQLAAPSEQPARVSAADAWPAVPSTSQAQAKGSLQSAAAAATGNRRKAPTRRGHRDPETIRMRRDRLELKHRGRLAEKIGEGEEVSGEPEPKMAREEGQGRENDPSGGARKQRQLAAPFGKPKGAPDRVRQWREPKGLGPQVKVGSSSPTGAPKETPKGARARRAAVGAPRGAGSRKEPAEVRVGSHPTRAEKEATVELPERPVGAPTGTGKALEAKPDKEDLSDENYREGALELGAEAHFKRKLLTKGNGITYEWSELHYDGPKALRQLAARHDDGQAEQRQLAAPLGKASRTNADVTQVVTADTLAAAWSSQTRGWTRRASGKLEEIVSQGTAWRGQRAMVKPIKHQGEYYEEKHQVEEYEEAHQEEENEEKHPEEEYEEKRQEEEYEEKHQEEEYEETHQEEDYGEKHQEEEYEERRQEEGYEEKRQKEAYEEKHQEEDYEERYLESNERCKCQGNHREYHRQEGASIQFNPRVELRQLAAPPVETAVVCGGLGFAAGWLPCRPGGMFAPVVSTEGRVQPECDSWAENANVPASTGTAICFQSARGASTGERENKVMYKGQSVTNTIPGPESGRTPLVCLRATIKATAESY